MVFGAKRLNRVEREAEELPLGFRRDTSVTRSRKSQHPPRGRKAVTRPVLEPQKASLPQTDPLLLCRGCPASEDPPGARAAGLLGPLQASPGSPQWLPAAAGRATASRVGNSGAASCGPGSAWRTSGTGAHEEVLLQAERERERAGLTPVSGGRASPTAVPRLNHDRSPYDAATSASRPTWPLF